MLVQVETNTKFEKGDYEIIRKQMKEKKLKPRHICQDLKISRSYFYDQVYGNRYATWELLTWFRHNEISVPFGEVIYKKS